MQAILFYIATKGIDGIKFDGIESPADFWHIEEPEVRRAMDNTSTEAELDALAKLFGGFG